MNLIITDSFGEKRQIGCDIVSSRTDVYTDNVKKGILSVIKKLNKSNYSIDDIFYVSVYDYWMYGSTIEEEFYLNFFNLSHKDKLKYITHMDRLNYMSYLNKKSDEYILSNKYETYKYLKGYYGRDVIFVDEKSGYNNFCAFVKKHKEFVVKPIGLATSIGVKKISIQADDDIESVYNNIIKTNNEICDKISWAKFRGVILEEVIQQGYELAQLHPASINSIRLTTIKVNGVVHIWYPVIRIGKANNFLCCGAVGSILAGININTGLTETDGFNELCEKYIIHPDTGMPIKGIKIPNWEELCKLAVELANKFETINYIGWDFVWTNENKWVVMEANENGEFLSQIAYKRGMKEELINLINWKSSKEFWWEGKYSML